MSERTMLAAVVTGFGGPERVELAEVPVPRPEAGQVRIRVAAAGLNPVDAGVRAGVFGGPGSGSASAGTLPGRSTRLAPA